MRRRTVLAAAAGLVPAGGCRALPAGGPSPDVGEHVQGEMSLLGTDHRLRLGDPDVYVARVHNAGHPAAVRVRLYWVPSPGAEPTGSHEALLAAGYDLAAERTVAVGHEDTRRVRFERRPPANTAGYYVRWHNLTYGAVVTNRGAAGRVRVALVDTTDMSDQRELASRTVRMDAGGRRTVTFRTDATFETFRVDARRVG